MKRKDEAIDIGTSELSKQFTVVPRLTRGHYGYNGKVMDETEIDRLLLQEIIDTNEHSTLEMFLMRLHRVGFIGLKSPRYDSAIHADPSLVGDHRAQAIRGINSLIRAMDQSMGREKRSALVTLVIVDTPWPFSHEELRECVRKLAEAM